MLRRLPGGSPSCAKQFDPGNDAGVELLHKARTRALEDVLAFFEAGADLCKAVIVDGFNSNAERRRLILDGLAGRGASVLFVESVVTDGAQLEANMRDICGTVPDYAALPPEAALADFRARVSHCEALAQSLDGDGSEAHLSWIRMINFRRYEVNNVHGFLQGRVAQLVMNLSPVRHQFYLTRHGQSEYNLLSKIGGDSPLSADGRKYAARLAQFASEVICRGPEGEQVPARLWTSGLVRAKQTAACIQHPTLQVERPPSARPHGVGADEGRDAAQPRRALRRRLRRDDLRRDRGAAAGRVGAALRGQARVPLPARRVLP